jgi:hypothetical protein
MTQIRPKTRLKGGMLCAVSEKRKENAPKRPKETPRITPRFASVSSQRGFLSMGIPVPLI